jgi:opacity protein-like surface antigen
MDRGVREQGCRRVLHAFRESLALHAPLTLRTLAGLQTLIVLIVTGLAACAEEARSPAVHNATDEPTHATHDASTVVSPVSLPSTASGSNALRAGNALRTSNTLRTEAMPPRLYASGGLASSVFAEGTGAGLPGPVSGFGLGASPGGGAGAGAEGAIGIAVARPAGSLRMEVEARGRQGSSAPGSVAGASPTQGWATMANVWRDVEFSKRFGCYAGGGVGGGGLLADAAGATAEFTDATQQRNGLAWGLSWQAGGGVTYAVSERVTLDLGVRYRGLEPVAGGDRATGSEAILAIRIFEPFRDVWK